MQCCSLETEVESKCTLSIIISLHCSSSRVRSYFIRSIRMQYIRLLYLGARIDSFTNVRNGSA